MQQIAVRSAGGQEERARFLEDARRERDARRIHLRLLRTPLALLRTPLAVLPAVFPTCHWLRGRDVGLAGCGSGARLRGRSRCARRWRALGHYLEADGGVQRDGRDDGRVGGAVFVRHDALASLVLVYQDVVGRSVRGCREYAQRGEARDYGVG